jgi:hypothetical protein
LNGDSYLLNVPSCTLRYHRRFQNKNADQLQEMAQSVYQFARGRKDQHYETAPPRSDGLAIATGPTVGIELSGQGWRTGAV